MNCLRRSALVFIAGGTTATVLEQTFLLFLLGLPVPDA
jgi:hypothetical protein